MRAFMWVHDHGELTPPSDDDYKAIYDGPEPDFAEAFVKRLLGRLPEEITEERHVRMLLAKMIICDDLQGDFRPEAPAILYTRREDRSRMYAFDAERIDALRLQSIATLGLDVVYNLAESLLYEVFLFS